MKPFFYNKFLSILTVIALYGVVCAGSAYAQASSTNYRMKACVLSNAGSNDASCVSSLGEPVVGNSDRSGTYLKMGFIPTSHIKILAISLSPDTWDIENVNPGEAATMSSEQSITIKNEGNTRMSPELIIKSAPGWTPSLSSGRERFSLRALICGTSDSPAEGNFEEEDSILADGKRASGSIFGYTASSQNGEAIPAKAERKLSLQFHSPGITELTDNQIQITVTAQEHR